jgi:hypothetical protein
MPVRCCWPFTLTVWFQVIFAISTNNQLERGLSKHHQFLFLIEGMQTGSIRAQHPAQKV